MPKYLSVVLAAALFTTASCGIAQQTTPKIKNVPIQPTSAVSGQEMYSTYCAVCHGADGRGNGPAASALKLPPNDLTVLSVMNGGKFPANHVITVLKFGVDTPAHGAPDMPVWGDLMQSLHKDSQHGSMLVDQRIKNLTDYLKQMQRTTE
jgi:mono/diheme cytochrome c family protein